VKTERVGAAFPDPPFNGMPGDGGLDIDLMTAIANAVRLYHRVLLSRITVAQAELENDGTLPQLRQRWLGSSAQDQHH
jgi:hypothetical protein